MYQCHGIDTTIYEPIKCIKKDERIEQNVVEKFRKVSDSVWICWKAVITEKALKEKWTNKNKFYDNYNLV